MTRDKIVSLQEFREQKETQRASQRREQAIEQLMAEADEIRWAIKRDDPPENWEDA